ncbi:MAG: gamma-glutamyl-phosphate reductase, partial [Gammaproteobacteria bacterium PRO8]|nr:gamma-glutamyl-phosphate reductase [Gammaproteobacteria bacterium PRO8]
MNAGTEAGERPLPELMRDLGRRARAAARTLARADTARKDAALAA